MFTGIIEETARVTEASSNKLVIAAGDVLKGLEPGGSISVNGVCLTITDLKDGSFSIDIMPETLRRTNLGWLRVGDGVNLERPLTLAKPLGGHLVQAHVDATGKVASVSREDEATIIRFEAPAGVMRYVVEKGFIAVDGVSLTVVARDTASFQVSIVGYTRQNTVLGSRRVGDLVNLEADIIAKYAEQLLRGYRSGVTPEFLKEHGFTTG